MSISPAAIVSFATPTSAELFSTNHSSFITFKGKRFCIKIFVPRQNQENSYSQQNLPSDTATRLHDLLQQRLDELEEELAFFPSMKNLKSLSTRRIEFDRSSLSTEGVWPETSEELQKLLQQIASMGTTTLPSFFPTDVLNLFFSFLDIGNRSSASRVCKLWNRLIQNDELFWKDVVLRDFRLQNPIKLENQTWKSFYRSQLALQNILPSMVYSIIELKGCHASAIKALAADDHVLVSGSKNGEIKVWPLDIRHDSMPKTAIGHTGDVFSLLIHEDTLFSCASDCTIRVWDLTTPSIDCKKVFHCKKVIEKILPQLLVRSYCVEQTMIPYSLAIGNGYLFASFLEEKWIYAWTLDDLSKPPITIEYEGEASCIAAIDNKLFVGCEEGRVYVFDLTDLNQKPQRYSIRTDFIKKIFKHRESVYFLTEDFHTYASTFSDPNSPLTIENKSHLFDKVDQAATLSDRLLITTFPASQKSDYLFFQISGRTSTFTHREDPFNIKNTSSLIARNGRVIAGSKEGSLHVMDFTRRPKQAKNAQK
ncbi:MAG: F-box-like domain-containing protein [Anaerolineae bacterium]